MTDTKPLTRKIKLGVYVPNTITVDKERKEYKDFVWKLLRNCARQNFEWHNLLVNKLIEIDSQLSVNLVDDQEFIELRNDYYYNRDNKKIRNKFYTYIKNKRNELVNLYGGKNLHGFIYKYLTQYIKNTPNDLVYLNSYSYCAISKNVVDKYGYDYYEVNMGKRLIANYKINQPIPINIKSQPKPDENGNMIKSLGKSWFNKYDDNYTFSFKSIKNHNIELFLIFGRDKSNNRAIIDRIYDNDSNYKLCDSKIQIVDNEIYLLMSFKQFVEPIKNLDPNKVLGVDLGLKFAAYVATNNTNERKPIADKEFALTEVRKRIEKDRRIAQKNSIFAKSGHGRKRKLKALNNRRECERNYRDYFNHEVSKNIINTAIKYGCGKINVEDLSKIPLKIKNKKVLRYWSYFDLLTKIEYKAGIAGIEFEKVNPAYTSQICSKCGEIGKRPRQETFICTNPKCGLFEKKINADANAAVNIAKNINKNIDGKDIKFKDLAKF